MRNPMVPKLYRRRFPWGCNRVVLVVGHLMHHFTGSEWAHWP